MNSKIKFIKFTKLWGVLFLLGIALTLISYEVFVSFQNHTTVADKMRLDFLDAKKSMIRQEVNQVIDLINYKIEHSKNKADTEKELLEIISRIRYGKEGYVFVNRLNGDALVSNGKILSGKEKLWEKYSANPQKMKNIFKMEYDAVQIPNGDFIYYSFIKLSNSKKESPKVSFICGIPELNWLVGAGVYLDDIDRSVALFNNELKTQIKTKLFFSILVIIIVIALFLWLLNRFSRKLQNDFDQFEVFFKKSAYEDKLIDLSIIKFAEFEDLAKSANRMLKDKIIAQDELLAEREQLFVTIRSIGDALITTDANGKIDIMNAVAEKLTGWKNEEANGRELTEVFNIVNENSREEVENPVSLVLEEGEIVGLANHTILISKDGTEYNIADSAAPIKDINNNILGVVLVFRDITDEYKIQEELRKSEDRYKITTDATGEVYYRLNFDNMSYEYIHPNVEKLTGYTIEEFNLKSIVIKIERRGNSLELNQMEENRKRKNAKLFNADYLIKTKSGKEKWIADVSFPIFDKDGNKSGSYGVLSDISARKEMEKKLVNAKEKAENADKMKSIFLAQMSHEIRTPINALVSMSSLLRYDFEESANEDQLMSFDVIDRAGERIIRTVDLLLNLSEIQAGTYETNPTKLDIVSDVLSIVTAEYKGIAKKKNINLRLNNITTTNTELIADPYTVNQIFTQLIDNAIKYTEKGEINIKVIRNKSEELVVEIKDTGIGIEDDYLPKIFEAFSQEEMGYTRKYEGNGIGLTLVKTYCELNNAIVSVKSKKGIGSTFTIVFVTSSKIINREVN